jgi:phage portal protein BeeE
MGILERLWGGGRTERRALSDSGMERVLLGGETTQAGVRVNGESAMSYPAFYACVRVIAEDVAQLPLKFYERLARRGQAGGAGRPALCAAAR